MIEEIKKQNASDNENSKKVVNGNEGIKKLAIEFCFATGFSLFICFAFLLLGGGSNVAGEAFIACTPFFGGVAAMLARRFLQLIINDFKKPYKAP